MLNRITDQNLDSFIQEWDNPYSHYKIDKVSGLKKSDIGNINNLGKASCAEARLFTRHHPYFVSSIEPKVKKLVLMLVENLSCITFSSCEGHREYLDQDNHLILKSRQREVSILTRNENEHKKLLQLLKKVAYRVNSGLKNKDVYVDIVEEVLEEKIGSHLRERKNISIIFLSYSLLG